MPDQSSVATTLTRAQVVAHRVRVHELGRADEHRTDAAVLDLGVQETGSDGALWALRVRGYRPSTDELFWAWTLRGAPHAYRRNQAAQVAAATAPWSDVDAGKRIFDAARPLRAAEIPILDALDHVAGLMRGIVTEPTRKGEVSKALSAAVAEPYLRRCNPCGTIHTYEQPFRLAALRAGLELEPDTSPPVLRRIPGWSGPATVVPPELDLVRAALHLLGPGTPKLVAGFLDTTVKEVAAHWPEDVVPVEVDGARLDVLAADLASYVEGSDAAAVALLGPFDLYLQGRDRELVVPDAEARKDLWRTLGRPGGVLVDGELVGSWRPRSAGKKLRLEVTMWDGAGRAGDGKSRPAALEREAERLADFRGVEFAGWV